MKTTSAALAQHLAGEVTTLATLWKVKRRDGQTFGFTDHDRNLPYDDGSGDGQITYVARSGYTRTAIESTADLAVDNLDIETFFDATGITSGANAGISREVKAYEAATGTITLFLPMPFAIEAGDAFVIYPGCDKRLETCINRFDNVLNFRGEPFVPGQDRVLRYPDASY